MNGEDWTIVPFIENAVIVYHRHGNYCSRVHQLKKDNFVCIICNTIIPNYLLFQIKLLEKYIFSFSKKDFTILNSKNLNIEALYLTKRNRLVVYDRYKEKEIKELLEFHNIVISKVQYYISASDFQRIV